MHNSKNIRADARLSETCRLPQDEESARSGPESGKYLDKNKTNCTEPNFSIGREPEPSINGESSGDLENYQTISLAIVDKSALFRAGLMSTLAGSRFHISASCADLEELTNIVKSERPSAAIITLDKESEIIIARLSEFVKQGIRLLVLSERFQSSEVFAAIEAGVSGYLLKNEINPDALLTSLELVCLQGIVLPNGFGRLIKNSGSAKRSVSKSIGGRDRLSSTCEAGDELARLSNRERMILFHLTQGAPNKQIARDLSIAEATVKVYVKSLLRKIRVENRTQAAIWAMGKFNKTTLGLFVAVCAVTFSFSRVLH